MHFMGTITARSGIQVGEFHRVIDRIGGRLVARHELLQLERSYQGSGFQADFNGALISWYRRSGVAEVRVHADIDVGGYTWASTGYDFGAAREASRIFGQLYQRMADMTGRDRLRGAWGLGGGAGQAMPTALRWTGGRAVNAPYTSAQLRLIFKGASEAEVKRQMALGQAFLDRVAGATFGDADFPSAYELSQLGRWKGAGKGDVWIGKLVMLGSDWGGILRL
jgi:hypothetical protein